MVHVADDPEATVSARARTGIVSPPLLQPLQARSRTERTVPGSGEPQEMHPSGRTVAPKLDAIQALRAIPASAAVLVHISVFHVLGTWGIDLFFAISGFIMCYVTARSDPNFFLKRMIRIAPLYWLGTLAVFAIALVMPALLNSSKANLGQLVNCFRGLSFRTRSRPESCSRCCFSAGRSSTRCCSTSYSRCAWR